MTRAIIATRGRAEFPLQRVNVIGHNEPRAFSHVDDYIPVTPSPCTRLNSLALAFRSHPFQGLLCRSSVLDLAASSGRITGCPQAVKSMEGNLFKPALEKREVSVRLLLLWIYLCNIEVAISFLLSTKSFSCLLQKVPMRLCKNKKRNLTSLTFTSQGQRRASAALQINICLILPSASS